MADKERVNEVLDFKKHCLFCEPWEFDQKEQILLHSDHFYLFAALGAIIEGYIIIAPYRCDDLEISIRSLADLTPELMDELIYLRALVSEFYRKNYDQHQPGMYFEHGRIPGCLTDPVDSKHCFHAHLCCYPASYPIWKQMQDYNVLKIEGLFHLALKAANSPYFFIQTCEIDEKTPIDSLKSENWSSHLAVLKNDQQVPPQYLRRLLATQIGEDKLWDWTAFPQWHLVEQLINDFRNWLLNQTNDKYIITLDSDEVPRIDFVNSIARSNEMGNDYIAKRFNEIWRGREQYNAVGRFLRHLPSYSPNAPNEEAQRPRILDAGCGPGFYMKIFDSLGLECVGIDVSSEMLAIASNALRIDERGTAANPLVPPPRLMKMNAFEPDFKEHSFDGVWYSAMLVHVPKVQVQNTLRCLFQILKENGILYISAQTGGDTVIRREGRVFFYYEDMVLRQLFRTIGFTLIEEWYDLTERGTCGDLSKKTWRHYLLKKAPYTASTSRGIPVLADLGEKGILNHIKMLIPPNSKENIFLGIGDDCAAIRPEPGELIVATTDPCPIPVVSILEEDDPWYYGWFSMIISLSDLGSMGAKPLGILLSIEAEETMSLNDLDRFYRGVIEASDSFDCPIIGGNIKDAPKFNCVGTALGSVPPNRILRRDTAQPGEYIIVLGEMGKFWAWVIHKLESIPLYTSEEQALLAYVKRPIPRIKEGCALSHNGLSRCAMDSSDGLVACLYEIARTGSNIDLHIDLSRIAIDPLVNKVAVEAGLDVRKLLLAWGDWELVCTATPDRLSPLLSVMKTLGCPVFSIGHVTKGKGNVWFYDQDKIGRLSYVASERFTSRSYFSHGLKNYLACMRNEPLYFC